MAAITAAGLRAAHPEWQNAPDDVVDHAVAAANARPLGLYADRSITGAAEETRRRYLEASSILVRHPYGRDMRQSDETEDVYRQEADQLDRVKGASYRVPGWPEVS